jgi:(4S)-4-hydroxy-5-phosphonooxypentane-2,3-dione isomerase
MHVTLVHIQVKSGHIDDFIAATKLNHEASIRETGTIHTL